MRVRTGHLVSVAVAMSLLMAGTAAASCETRAFIKLSPPPYTPGGTVTVTGERFEPGTTVRTRVGTSAATSTVVGEATTSAEGTWEVSFQVPTNARARGYAVMADALHSDGTLVTATAEMRMEARAPAATAPQPIRTERERGDRGGRDGRGGNSSQRSDDGSPTSTQPVVTSAPAPLPATTPSTLSSQAADDARPGDAPVAKPRAEPGQAAPATPAPDAAVAPPPAAAAAPEAAPVYASAAEATDEFVPMEVLVVLCALILWGSAGWVALARRGRPPLEAERPDWPPPSGPPQPGPAASPEFEAALQELIAEEHAREREREPVGAGAP